MQPYALPPSTHRRTARLRLCREVRGDCSEWEVDLGAAGGSAGDSVRAVAFASLAGPLSPGDLVLLNTTAVDLSLGTGGVHFIISRLDNDAVGASPPVFPAVFPGRGAGHLLKLRYTPLQVRVLSVEDEASTHRGEIETFAGLAGTPVVVAELHSQGAAAAIAARACGPELRIVLVQTDSAALPLSLSRLLSRLRADGVLDATISAGQAFGGDYEAVNIHTALIAAHAAAGAEVIVVTQGPGNAGTGTRYGFSGLALVEALHAADLLGGRAVLAARMSAVDPRPRHRGLSHHTVTLLECARVPVTLVLPPESAAAGTAARAPHGCSVVDPGPVMEALRRFGSVLTSMNRSVDQDVLFFRAAAAAGVHAANAARSRRLSPG